MTSGEINAAYDSVTSAFGLITSLIGGNITVIFALFTVVGVVAVFAFLLRALYSAVGLKNIP